MEHRWGLRRRVYRSVHVWTVGRVASVGRLRDVSISGAFVETSLPVQPLSRVRFQFKPTAHEARSRCTADAQVVRLENHGFAVEWCEFAPPAVRSLIRTARAEMLSGETNGEDLADTPSETLAGTGSRPARGGLS
jgi:hypothetical protein